MTWRARTPCGVFVSIRTPAFAVGEGGGAQLVDRPATVTRAVSSAGARRGLLLRVGPGNVQHNLELKQLGAGRDRVGALAGVGGNGWA